MVGFAQTITYSLNTLASYTVIARSITIKGVLEIKLLTMRGH